MKKDEIGPVLFFKISLPKDVFGRKFDVSSFLLQEDQDSGLNFNIRGFHFRWYNHKMPNCHLLSFKGPIQPQNAKELYPASYKGLGLSLASKELVKKVVKYMLSFTVIA